MKTPQEIVDLMMQNDAFSQWMNVEVLKIGAGFCTVSCEVNSEMLNGFHILHGGISYSLADSALAFASNSYGNHCVSIETSISHTKPAKLNDTLFATCEELHRGKTTGIYEVKVTNQDQKLIALFKGTVHVSEKKW
jgi:acyl-CoA thioesterase